MDTLSIGEARAMLAGESGEGGDTGVQAHASNEAALDAAAASALEQLRGKGADGATGEAGSADTARAPLEGGVGLGVDIVEITRMKSILLRTPAFAERVFSQAERDYCEKTANPATHYALRFAAKEAVVKALGTGLAEGIGVLDVEVERASNGRPSAKLHRRALEVAREQGLRSLSISLSYTHTDAVACALAITDDSLKASEKHKDPMAELARQFKETRGMLDEL